MSKKTDYLGAFMRHPYNRVTMLAAGCGAIFASIPYGWQGLALVGVMALGTEILAALAIPELPPFKAWADREQHRQARAQRRLQLLAELSQHGDTQALASYQRMYDRVQALHRTAEDARTTLTPEDVDKLEDLTVDYLGLSALNLSLKQGSKQGASEDTAARRIAGLQAQLQGSKPLSAEEERQLRSALAEYTEVLHRARRLAVRRSALEATLLSMPDKMEEVYQLVMTAPYSSEMGGKLEESLARLRIAEEVAAEFDAGDLSSAQPFWTTTTTAATTSATAAPRNTTGQPARRAPGSVKH